MNEKTLIFVVRTTAGREEQVMDFVTENARKKGYEVHDEKDKSYVFKRSV